MIKVKHFNLKKIPLFVALCLSSPFTIAGSIGSQMDNAFNALVNVTDAGTYDTARRGVISGGQIFIKTPTKRVNPFSATAPSFSAGCGGIDMYGGSFSFINADEMVETFQAIGANALGYGVKLAVGAACPSCEQVMTSLEKTAQFINSINIDSCQAAEGIVDAGIDSIQKKSLTTAKLKGVEYGEFDDVSKAWGDVGKDKSAANKLKDNHPEEYKKEMTGNVAWRAFQDAKLQDLFAGDNDLLELVMTITGTVIMNDTTSGDDDSSPKPTTLKGHGVSLEALINKSEGADAYKIYKCDTTDKDGCLNPESPASKIVTDKGLKQRVYEALTGDKGYINSLRTDKKMSDEDQTTLSMTTPIGALCMNTIYNAMVTSKDNNVVAQNVAAICSDRMALEAAFAQVLSYFDAAKAALNNFGDSESQKAAKNEAILLFNQSQTAYLNEYRRLGKDISYNDIKQKIDQRVSGTTMKSTQGVK